MSSCAKDNDMKATIEGVVYEIENIELGMWKLTAEGYPDIEVISQGDTNIIEEDDEVKISIGDVVYYTYVNQDTNNRVYEYLYSVYYDEELDDYLEEYYAHEIEGLYDKDYGIIHEIIDGINE